MGFSMREKPFVIAAYYLGVWVELTARTSLTHII